MSLGIFATARELASIVVGIVLLTVVRWIINRCFGAPVPVWRPKEQTSRRRKGTLLE